MTGPNGQAQSSKGLSGEARQVVPWGQREGSVSSAAVFLRLSELRHAIAPETLADIGDLAPFRQTTHPLEARGRMVFIHPLTPSEALLDAWQKRAAHARAPALVALFDSIAQHWRLSEPESNELLGFDREPAFLAGLMRQGLVPLPRDTRDRIAAILEIHRSLDFRFETDAEAERQFLLRRNEDLGSSPMEAMLRGGLEGLLRVRDYLRWIDGR